MPKRGENIHKRKDGRWEARYKQGTDPNGRAKYGSVYGKTYREAKSKLMARISNIEFNDQRLVQPPLFQNVLALWLEDNKVRLKGSTVCRYRYLIDTHIVPALGRKRIDQISGTQINCFLDDKLNHGRLDGTGGLSQAYVRSIMLIIQSSLNYAVTQEMCQALRTKICKPPNRPKKLTILCAKEQQKLEAACLTDIDETKIGILLSLYTGLRIGEVCALSWSDVDLDEQIIYVRHTISRINQKSPDGKTTTILTVDQPKTLSSVRYVPLCSWLTPILLLQKDRAASEYVISQKHGFVNPRTYEYRYHRVLQTGGIADINYHALRHTFATRCIESGMDVKTLSEILGHADASTTLNTYVHSSLERKRIQLEKLYTQTP